MGKASELREEMKRVVASLDRRWLHAASAKTCALLATLIERELPNVEHALAWIPSFPGEVNLLPFITSQVGRYSVYLPRLSSDRSMTFVSLGDNWEELVGRGEFGLRARADRVPTGAVYDPSFAARTVVLVPGLAFDREGHRLARRQAYYDNFLLGPGMNEAAVIGVCWSLQLLPSPPPGAARMNMDWVCHERGWVKCDEMREAAE